MSLRGLTVLLLVLSGCASTTRVGSGELPAHVDEINRLGERHPARVVLADGRRESVQGVRVAADSVSWINDGRLTTLALTDVTTLRFVNRGRGATQGALAGLGSALVLGAAFRGNEARTDLAGNVVLGTLLAGLLAVPLGTLAGQADGHQTVFYLPAAAPQTPTRRRALRSARAVRSGRGR